MTLTTTSAPDHEITAYRRHDTREVGQGQGETRSLRSNYVTRVRGPPNVSTVLTRELGIVKGTLGPTSGRLRSDPLSSPAPVRRSESFRREPRRVGSSQGAPVVVPREGEPPLL